MLALAKPSQPTAEMDTFPPNNPENKLLSSGDCEVFTVAKVVRILICANVGPGLLPTALAVNFVVVDNVPLLTKSHTPPAMLVGIVLVAITRIASLLLGSSWKVRSWLTVTRVPQVAFRVCCVPAGTKLLRAALWVAYSVAVDGVAAQLPPRLTASSTAMSATRCSLRCSR